MSQELSTAIREATDALKQLGPGAWDALVRQQLIEAWVWLGVSVVLGIGMAAAVVRVWRFSKQLAPIDRVGPDVVAVCLCLALLLCAQSAITQGLVLLSPEVYAAKTLFAGMR